MDYIDRFLKRGQAIKGAFRTDAEAAPQHRSVNLLTDVLVDIVLRAKLAGKDPATLLSEAVIVADQEFYFAEAALREAMKPS